MMLIRYFDKFLVMCCDDDVLVDADLQSSLSSCLHSSLLTLRSLDIVTDKDQQQPQQPHQNNTNNKNKKTEPGKLDVDVNTDLLQLNLLHPSLTRYRWHHFWNWLAHLHNDEIHR